MTRRAARHAFFAVAALTLLSATDAVAACSGSGLTWSCAAGSTISEVNTVLKSAADGATVTFDAGSYTWTVGSIVIDNAKGVTLACAAVRACLVTKGTNTIVYIDQLSGQNARSYRVTGFVFQGGSGYVIWWYSGNGTTPSTMQDCRIDHNTIDGLATGSIAILLGGGSTPSKFKCVIDNNVFSGVNNFMSLKYLGPGNPDQYPSSVRATADNVFLEDNTYTFTNASDLGSGCIDVWNAGSVVVRHNDSTNCLWTAHGVTHATVVNFEIYQNTLRRTVGSGYWTNGYRLFHHQGSGEITVWGNQFAHTDAIAANAISVTHFRSATPAAAGYGVSLGRCDGTTARDGNLAPNATNYGYPCWMQPGRAPSGGLPGYGTLSPMYAWMNVDATTGNAVPIHIEDLWAGPPFVSTHIQADRDYYNAVSNRSQTSSSGPFDGTTGMGFGTLANRPTTCTTNVNETGGGVAYWATDVGEWDTSHAGPDGELFRCSAPNTWTLDYVPYAYPHPLRSRGRRPSPPTRLRVVP